MASKASAESDRLSELVVHPGWKDLVSLVDQTASASVNQLLYTSDSAQVHFLRGYITGLRYVPSTVTSTVEIRRAAAERALVAKPDRDAARRRAALYGTAFWRPEDSSPRP